jgi:hypothetical protein
MAFVIGGRKSRAFFVLAGALFLAAFAIYLKASAVERVHAATSTVKIWADPNNKVVDHKISVSPAPLLPLLFLLSTLALSFVEHWCFDLSALYSVLPKLFLQPPNWRRPPPLRQA